MFTMRITNVFITFLFALLLSSNAVITTFCVIFFPSLQINCSKAAQANAMTLIDSSWVLSS